MNSFSQVFQQAIINDDHFLRLISGEFAHFALIYMLIVSSFLIFNKKPKIRYFILAAPVSYISGLLLDFSFEPFSGVEGIIGRLSVLALLIVGSSLIGMVLISISTVRKWRSPDRFSFGLALLVTSVLSISYHVVLINGQMNLSLDSQEKYLSSALRLEKNSFYALCEMNEWDCEDGDVDSNYSIGEGLIEKHFNDYLGFYRDQSNGKPFMFSDSVAFILEEKSYIYAYAESNGKFRMVKESDNNWAFTSADIAFKLFYTSVYAFWSFFAVGISIGHRRKIRLKKSD